MTTESSSMEFWIRFAIASLAAWRITHLLAHEDGPGDVIYRLRALGGAGFWGRLLDCFYCLSLWIAAPLSPLVVVGPSGKRYQFHGNGSMQAVDRGDAESLVSSGLFERVWG